MSPSSFVPSIFKDIFSAPYHIWNSISDEKKNQLASPDKAVRQKAYDTLEENKAYAWWMLRAVMRISLAAIAIFAVLKYKINPTSAAVGGLLLSVPTVWLAGGAYVGYLAVNTIIKAVALNSLNLGVYGIGLGLASWGILDSYSTYQQYGVLENPVIFDITYSLRDRVVKLIAVVGMNCCYKSKVDPAGK